MSDVPDISPTASSGIPPGYALGVWLTNHPHAVVSAVGPDGTPVPMPPAVPLLPTHQVDDRSFLALVEPGEVSHVVSAFRDAVERGVSVTDVVMADGRRVQLHYIDSRDDYGVILRLVLAAETGARDDGARRLTADAMPSRPRLAVVEKDELSTIRAIDAATTSLLGWTDEAVVGQPTLSFIHPDDHPRAIDNWMEMMAHGVRHAVRLRYRAQDGTWIWFETSNELCLRADGTRYVTCQMIDISEEMAAADALRYNEHLLRRMAETVPVGLVELGPDRAVRYTNGTLRELMASHKIESLEDFLSALADSDRSRFQRALDDALAQGIDSDVDLHLPATAATPDRHCRVALRSLTEGPDVLGALLCVMDVTELKTQAATDPLTGLLNRSSILDTLRAALAEPHPVGVIFVDLDQFKPINDVFGHEKGDAVLVRVAQALRGAVRAGDAVGRIGGDEFLVVCPDVSDDSVLAEVARRLHRAAGDELAGPELGFATGASVGMAWLPAGSATVEVATARADAAMYRAKQSAAGVPVLWDETMEPYRPPAA